MNGPSKVAPSRRFLRTDVRFMRRGDLFRSSGEFLVGGVLASGLWYLLRNLGRSLPGPPRGFVEAAGTSILGVSLIALVVMAGMGLLGALHLFVRGCLRSRNYDPYRAWLADEPKQVAGKQ